MNSNICDRCKIKASDFICNECNGSFCAQCDGFVHSSLKHSHKRKKLTSPTIQNSKKNKTFENNLNSYSNHKNYINETNTRNKNKNLYNISSDRLYYSNNDVFNINNEERKAANNNIISNRIRNQNFDSPNISLKYVNQIKEIYEQERKGLILKINELTQELESTKKNLSERIEYLHRHLYEVENKHKLELNEERSKNGSETKKLEDEKNIKINKLQNIINSQNNTINELKEKIKNLENSINDKESIYLKKDRDVGNIINEKESLENYYKNEIE